MPDQLECTVIGGGAAGLAASLVLGRARRRTLLLDAGGQSNRAAAHVGGLLGHDGTPPGELYAHAAAQLDPYTTVERRAAAAEAIRSVDGGFEIEAGGETHRSRTVVIATGIDYVVPDPFREHWGRFVFHCPFCDGWEQRDRRVAVCGSGERADHQATLLSAWTADVVRVDAGSVTRLEVSDGALRGLGLRDGATVACEAAFVTPDLRPRTAATAGLGLDLRDDGTIAVDGAGETNVAGVFAAGDVAGALTQVSIAAASGHMAGLGVVRELVLGA